MLRYVPEFKESAGTMIRFVLWVEVKDLYLEIGIWMFLVSVLMLMALNF